MAHIGPSERKTDLRTTFSRILLTAVVALMSFFYLKTAAVWQQQRYNTTNTPTYITQHTYNPPTQDPLLPWLVPVFHPSLQVLSDISIVIIAAPSAASHSKGSLGKQQLAEQEA